MSVRMSSPQTDTVWLVSGDVRPSVWEHTPGRTGYCREQSFKKVHLIRVSV